MDKVERVVLIIVVALVMAFLYGVTGTSGNIEEIKRMAEIEIPQRNWEIMRYEGYEWGSYSTHGGSVYYHVRDRDNTNIQYRVKISLWAGELQYYYDEPESVERVIVNYN